MEYVVAVLLVLVLIELRKLREISVHLEGVQVRLFHIEKSVIEAKEQVEAFPKLRDHD